MFNPLPFEKRMTRNDCINWLLKNGYDIPQKSACYFCPYRSTSEWKKVFLSNYYDNVIKLDEKIRHSYPGCSLYLHSSRTPLADVAKNSLDDKQIPLWDSECLGICGV